MLHRKYGVALGTDALSCLFHILLFIVFPSALSFFATEMHGSVLCGFYTLVCIFVISLLCCLLTDPGAVTPAMKTDDILEIEKAPQRRLAAMQEKSLRYNRSGATKQTLSEKCIRCVDKALNCKRRRSLRVHSVDVPKIEVTHVDTLGQDSDDEICTKCSTMYVPRAHHCRRCDRCIRRFDHHCVWVGTCIGLRNYRYFFVHLTSLTGIALLLFAVNVRTLHEEIRCDAYRFFHPSTHFIFLNVLLAVYAGVVSALVGVLYAQHIWLLMTDTTTHELLVGQVNGLQSLRGVGSTFYQMLVQRVPKSFL